MAETLSLSESEKKSLLSLSHVSLSGLSLQAFLLLKL